MTTNIFKPILFNTEMVQAILAGRKTQTRRLQGLSKYNRSPDLYGIGNVRINGYFNFYRIPDEKGYWETPKFETGDILWVRETSFEVTDNIRKFPLFEHFPKNSQFLYKSEFPEIGCHKWKPSLFMPKKAARIFLKVTNVRCERLQDISEEDAIAEGIERYGPFGEFKGDPHPSGGMMRFRAYSKAARAFQDLWDSINAKKQPWESNPWVWVYDFERIEKPENFLS